MDDEKFPTPDRLPGDLPPLKTDDDEAADQSPDKEPEEDE
jgi:hypothetical protein